MKTYLITLNCSPKTPAGKQDSLTAIGKLGHSIKRLGSVLKVSPATWLLVTDAELDAISETVDDDSITWDLLMGEERVMYIHVVVEIQWGESQSVSGPSEYRQREVVQDWLMHNLIR